MDCHGAVDHPRSQIYSSGQTLECKSGVVPLEVVMSFLEQSMQSCCGGALLVTSAPGPGGALHDPKRGTIRICCISVLQCAMQQILL